jgi:hypothetical protein
MLSLQKFMTECCRTLEYWSDTWTNFLSNWCFSNEINKFVVYLDSFVHITSFCIFTIVIKKLKACVIPLIVVARCFEIQGLHEFVISWLILTKLVEGTIQISSKINLTYPWLTSIDCGNNIIKVVQHICLVNTSYKPFICFIFNRDELYSDNCELLLNLCLCSEELWLPYHHSITKHGTNKFKFPTGLVLQQS